MLRINFMKTIERENFEAWLFAQPRERSFNFVSRGNCPIACFLRETTPHTRALVGMDHWLVMPRADCGSQFEILPDWLRVDMPLCVLPVALRSWEYVREYLLTAGQIQDRYIEVFGDPRFQNGPVCDNRCTAGNFVARGPAPGSPAHLEPELLGAV